MAHAGLVRSAGWKERDVPQVEIGDLESGDVSGIVLPKQDQWTSGATARKRGRQQRRCSIAGFVGIGVIKPSYLYKFCAVRVPMIVTRDLDTDETYAIGREPARSYHELEPIADLRLDPVHQALPQSGLISIRCDPPGMIPCSGIRVEVDDGAEWHLSQPNPDAWQQPARTDCRFEAIPERGEQRNGVAGFYVFKHDG